MSDPEIRSLDAQIARLRRDIKGYEQALTLNLEGMGGLSSSEIQSYLQTFRAVLRDLERKQNDTT